MLAQHLLVYQSRLTSANSTCSETESESESILDVKGHCTFRNLFSTCQLGRFIRHQSLFL
jgi:hypothetical protein